MQLCPQPKWFASCFRRSRNFLAENLMNIEARTDQYLELEKIALGGCPPLTGLMKEDDFESVVDTMRLSTGELFPLPVIFDVAENAAAAIKVGDSVGVTYRGRAVGEILVESIYRCDK